MNYDQTRFKKLFEFGQKLRSRYMRTLTAKKLFDEFNRLSATNIVGKKKAEANVKMLNSYKYFFLASKEALRCYLLIELAKFFDEDKRNQCLTIEYTIGYAQKRLESFSEVEFLKFHKDRKILPELFKDFGPLSKSELAKIQNRLRRNEDSIARLKKYRDQYLAHDDRKKKEVNFNGKDVNVLLKIVKDTVDLIYRRLEFASNDYRNFEEQPVLEINYLFQTLKEATERKSV